MAKKKTKRNERDYNETESFANIKNKDENNNENFKIISMNEIEFIWMFHSIHFALGAIEKCAKYEKYKQYKYEQCLRQSK